MNAARITALLALVVGVTSAWGQAVRPDPQIGYVYPAGGRKGTTVRVLVGGQLLRDTTAAYVSGTGVSAKVIKGYGLQRNLDAEQRAALADQLREAFRKRWDELVAAGKVRGPLPLQALAGFGVRRTKPTQSNSSSDTPAKIPEFALLYDLDHQSLRELLHSVLMLRATMQEQGTQQLATNVLVEVTIDRDAEPGNRELRLLTRAGLTNPVCFQVGVLPEVGEAEVPERLESLLPAEPPLSLPVTLNGQIMAGDVDRFRFHAKQGQQLVIVTHARELIPFLADAVPGWFQATLTLYDASGAEVAFDDDYEFSPDPVLHYVVPADGDYELEIRDAIYRGRQDFVYRINLGECPFITALFPLGCRVGQQRYVAVDGWNLCSDRLYLDARKQQAGGIRETPLGHGRAMSNVVAYEVDALPASVEVEGNDTLETAQVIHPPLIIDGRIGTPGDLDVFAFKGKADAPVVVEVVARRVRSPLDALVRLLDADGNVVAWNDDYERKDGYLHTSGGTLTQDADSYLRTQLPADGTYYVHVTDAQARGGAAFAYRLRVEPPRPDFELRCTPASLNVRGGLWTPLQVYALRKDGFAGPIDITVADPATGVSLAGARIPAGRDTVRMTFAVESAKIESPLALTLEGHAQINGQCVTRTVVPAEDCMQAFLYRHLVPADELLVAVMNARGSAPPLQFVEAGPVQIPLGGDATVHLRISPFARRADITLQLREPPAEITLVKFERFSDGFALTFHADAESASVGFADNLIIDVITGAPQRRQGDAAGRPQARLVAGVLPALPVEVVPR